MPDTNPQNNSPKNIQDFEMGSDVAAGGSGVTVPPPAPPTINKYPTNASPAPTPAAKVDPTAGTPIAPAPSSPNPAPVQPTPATPPAAKPTTPTPVKSAPPMNPATKRKAIIGCLGAFGSLMLILLILSFIFLAQSGDTQNPIAKLLGINQGVFINGLINFIHIIFILISLTTFVFTMVGLFKSSMAKRDDKETRKKGLKTALISGIVLFSVLIVWGFTYIYLDGKRVQVNGEILDPIVTTPDVNKEELSAPVLIKFDASNLNINKNAYQIISHEWDFGDGETGTNQITDHLFKEKGVYTVKLTVTVKDKSTGELGIGGEYSVIVPIENQSLAAIIKADPQSGEAPLEVSFDASDSADPDGNIKSYEWDLDGDGQFDDAKGEKVERTFEKVGKYKVSLRVTSTTDEFDIDEKEIIVEEESNPTAVITVVDNPKTFIPGANYIFKADDSSSPNGKISKYEWSFSDTTKIETTKTISHIFKQPGTYEITLKVTDEDDEEGEVKKIIKVDSPKGSPKAKINTDPQLVNGASSLSGKAPFTVTFDSKGTTDSDDNIVDYKWDFDGDGQFDSFGSVVSHTYTQEGTYNIELEVQDSDKNVGKASLVVKVESAGVIAAVVADKVDGNVPLTVNFDASGSTYSKGQITSYKWDFGDETPAKIGAATISHKYTAVGSYNTTVTVTASDGSSASKSMTITVREIPLSACFDSVLESGTAPLETTFDPGCSTGAITSYFWDFGDGATSTSVKPTHEFTEAGEYTVTLEVSDSQNTVDLSEMTITVTK